MSRAPRLAAVLATALALLAGAAATAGAAGTARPEPPGTLYVLQAGGGSLERVPGGWRLVLRDADATVTTFTDRPARVGGSQRLRGFVASWGAAFGGDPPNAALQLDRAPAGRDVVLVELRRPRYDARAGTLTFRARPLRTTRQVLLGDLARRADAHVARTFGRASLFIDDGPSAAAGFQVTLDLVGGNPGTGPVAFTLGLGNASFQEAGQLQSTFGFGRTVTTSYTVEFGVLGLEITLPAGTQAVGTVSVAFPATGGRVQGFVTLPPGYQVTLSSSAGQVQVSQSGPVTIPTPPDG